MYPPLNPFQQDFGFYLNYLENTHYNPYANLPKPEFDRYAAQLLEDLASENDSAMFLARLKEFTTRLGDAHTSVSDRGIDSGPRFVVTVKWFADGWFVHGIDEAHEEWIGARIEAINDTPVDSFAERLTRVICAENVYWRRTFVSNALSYPANLRLLHLDAPDGICRIH